MKHQVKSLPYNEYFRSILDTYPNFDDDNEVIEHVVLSWMVLTPWKCHTMIRASHDDRMLFYNKETPDFGLLAAHLSMHKQRNKVFGVVNPGFTEASDRFEMEGTLEHVIHSFVTVVGGLIRQNTNIKHELLTALIIPTLGISESFDKLWVTQVEHFYKHIKKPSTEVTRLYEMRWEL